MAKKLRCYSLDGPTRMFTKGKPYTRDDAGYVVDNLGHDRFIGSSLSFVTGHNRDDSPQFARFEEVGPDAL